MLSKSDIEKYLLELNNRLRVKGLCGEIFLYGGAVMCLALNARAATHDIDALFEPKMEINRIAKEMECDYGLPEGWLNDSVKGFVSVNNAMEPFYELSNLRIFVTRIDYLFAMKVMSARVGSEYRDVDDIKFLIGNLGLRDFDSAYRIVLNYFPEHLIPARSRYLLMELLG